MPEEKSIYLTKKNKKKRPITAIEIPNESQLCNYTLGRKKSTPQREWIAIHPRWGFQQAREKGKVALKETFID